MNDRKQKLSLKRKEAVQPRFFITWNVLLALAVCFLFTAPAMAAPTAHNIPAAVIDVPTTSGATPIYSMNDFRVVSSIAGMTTVQIGETVADDQANGVIISSVAQNVRTDYGTNMYGISMIETNTDGSYKIVTVKAGPSATRSVTSFNVAAAYFPYSAFLAGHIRTEPHVNAGTNHFYTGSPLLSLGTHIKDLKGITNGVVIFDFTSLGINSQTDGVLLVNHGKGRGSGDGNYAVSFAQPDGTWWASVQDGDGGTEHDPMAFAYVPRTDKNFIVGRFTGDGTIHMSSGDSPQFEITPIAGGRWLLTIPGHAPTNGVLIVSGEWQTGGQNRDNITSYQATDDGIGWEINQHDLPGLGFQTPGGGASFICSFVYIPGPTPGFAVKPTQNLLTTETGGTAQFTVALDTKPTGDVVVNLSSSDTTEGTVSPSSLTFTPQNWETPQTVTLTGQDDAEQDGLMPYTIVLAAATSTDTSYNGMKPSDVQVLNVDNEPGISTTKISLTTTEAGGTDTFDVFLNTAPAADVTIGLQSNDATEGTVSPATVTFTPGNWNVPQTVTVTGVNDLVDDGDISYTIVTTPAVSTDGTYNNLNALDLAAVNVDDDTAALILNPAGPLQVSEAGTSAGFTVALTSEPTANVTVSFASGDATEGSVSPTSRTFTTANWATPQSFTVTGVDDAVNDGTVTFSVNGTVSSSDPVYAAVTAAIDVLNADNEAALAVSSELIYGAGQPAKTIDGFAMITDPDTANYAGGTLTATLTLNGSTDDQLGIRNVGTGAGQVGVSGNNVSYEGTTIGTWSGGSGTTPLVITFNSAATPTAAQAVLRSLTYHNVSATPSTAPRILQLALNDGQGGTSTTSLSIKTGLLRITDVQEGVDRGFGPYTGTVDVEINTLNYTTPYPMGSDPSGLVVFYPDSVVLLRFDNLIGNDPGQIPANAKVVSADLILDVNDGGLGGAFHRMLMPWTGNDTWDTLGGIQTDDVEAKATYESQWGSFPPSGASGTGSVRIGVLADVQAWVNGQANYGWAIVPWLDANNNTVFSPAEAEGLLDRPRLVVKWVPAETQSASFRQGVNGYTSARDTRILEGTPDVESSTNDVVFIDGEVTGGMLDQSQFLIRFENLFGSNPGQIPSGSIIHAAVLDLDSTVSNGVGHGGSFHAMLTPWLDTATWNSLNDGVTADDIEAAATVSAPAGSETLSPMAQAAYLSFDVAQDVQAWSSGVRPNYGWAGIPWPRATDGWGLNTSDSATEQKRPRLRVYYSPGAAVAAAVLQTPSKAGASIVVPFTGTANTTYSVQRSTSLSGGWGTIGQAPTGGTGVGSYTDNAPPADGAFYRIIYP